MVTREQIDAAFENKSPFSTKNIDYDVKAISLLRERIPYDVCKGIINGAEHDKIYLCDLEDSMPYLTEEDLAVLADCNVLVEREYDSFALFV